MEFILFIYLFILFYLFYFIALLSMVLTFSSSITRFSCSNCLTRLSSWSILFCSMFFISSLSCFNRAWMYWTPEIRKQLLSTFMHTPFPYLVHNAIVCTPSLSAGGGGGGLNPPPNFQKRGGGLTRP